MFGELGCGKGREEGREEGRKEGSTYYSTQTACSEILSTVQLYLRLGKRFVECRHLCSLSIPLN